MIPQRNISLITNSLVTDNKRRLPEAVIERDYVLAWFLSGLSNHPLREKLAFKGGTTLRRCWFDGYRFSEEDVMQNVVVKEDRLRRLWGHRLSQQVSDLPSYDSVYRDVKRALRAADLDHRADGQPSNVQSRSRDR